MLVAQTAIGPAWPFFGAVAVGLAPAEVVPEEHDGRLLASHEVARSVRNPLAGAAATNGNPKAAMSVISPPGSAIRTSSPFRRATALAAVSQPDVRSHLICLVRRLDGDELQAEVLGSLDEPVQMPWSITRPVSAAVPATGSICIPSNRKPNGSPSSPRRTSRYRLPRARDG